MRIYFGHRLPGGFYAGVSRRIGGYGRYRRRSPYSRWPGLQQPGWKTWVFSFTLAIIIVAILAA